MCAGLLQLPAGLHARVRGPASDSRARSSIRSSGPRTSTTRGKRVVVIGSGATAMTLVPAMAKDVAPHRHAAALADLRRLASGHATASRTPCARCCPSAGRTRSRAGRTSTLQQWLYRRTRTHPEQVKQKLLDDGAEGARAGLRRRDAFHAALQPVGSAPLPGAEQRPVRGDPLRQGDRSSPISIERFTETGIALAVGRAARGRHHRHRDRPESRRAGRDASSRSTARRSISRRPGPTRA